MRRVKVALHGNIHPDILNFMAARVSKNLEQAHIGFTIIILTEFNFNHVGLLGVKTTLPTLKLHHF
jgi:hypothetical protein